MEHDDSVDFYTVGLVRMRICFPHGKADCRHCRFLRFREHLGIYQCSLTEEWVEKYELDQRHTNCPVEIPDTPF